MFVDRVDIYCKAGDGGNGCLSFRKEPFVPRGGPNGGDGGNGGDIIVMAVANVGNLANIAGHKHWNGEAGNHGEGSLRTGKRGQPTKILVPPGTLVRDFKRGHVLKDLASDGDSIVVARGGKGGKGNKRFATAQNRVPREFEPGAPGEERHILLELKLIADVGLLGKPNAGKSTLLSRISQAEPEIADYPFTTKFPNLGLVRIDYDREFVVADIPGLIEGAHAGVGLGHEFLRHVERTRLLVHLVEPSPMDGTNPVENYHQIRNELKLYGHDLEDRPEIIVITKCELPDAEAARELLQDTLPGKEILLISAVTGKGLPQLINRIFDRLGSAEV
ncbi:GTPase Obg [Polystyrenella longa]|uniref:GTPase Obg n=1 Tax=Polystyrenella longa TaxID=2528007 RepID=A0A518CSP7_9PLAN|nr:GTPase ObgE [Polystyrenella longa]QDU82253.1 GTPase Obg [Polystyrenella longa]